MQKLVQLARVGNGYIVDNFATTSRVRRVDTFGIISTLTGSTSLDFSWGVWGDSSVQTVIFLIDSIFEELCFHSTVDNLCREKHYRLWRRWRCCVECKFELSSWLMARKFI